MSRNSEEERQKQDQQERAFRGFFATKPREEKEGRPVTKGQVARRDDGYQLSPRETDNR